MRDHMTTAQTMDAIMSIDKTLSTDHARNLVDIVNGEHCEPTHRLMADQDTTEWMAEICIAKGLYLRAWYVTDAEEEAACEGDLSGTDWDGARVGYTIDDRS